VFCKVWESTENVRCTSLKRPNEDGDTGAAGRSHTNGGPGSRLKRICYLLNSNSIADKTVGQPTAAQQTSIVSGVDSAMTKTLREKQTTVTSATQKSKFDSSLAASRDVACAIFRTTDGELNDDDFELNLG
jgi:hypothetical protein